MVKDSDNLSNMGRAQGTTQGLTEAEPRKKYVAADFEDEVRTLSNRALVERTASAILGAAIMESRPRFNNSKDDAFTDAAYAEANRRDNPDLYQRAFNDAVRSQGHTGMVQKVRIPIDFGDPTLSKSEGLEGDIERVKNEIQDSSLLEKGGFFIKDETGVERAELDPSLSVEEAKRICGVYARDIGYASLWWSGIIVGHSDGEVFSS